MSIFYSLTLLTVTQETSPSDEQHAAIYLSRRDYFLEIMTNGQLWSNPCFPGHVIMGKTRVKIVVTGSFPRNLLTLFWELIPFFQSILPAFSQEDPEIVSAEVSLTGGSPLSWVQGCALSLGLQSLGAAGVPGGCALSVPVSAKDWSLPGDPGTWGAESSVTPGHLSSL